MTTESIDTNILLRAALDLGDQQTVWARDLLASPDRQFTVHPIVWAEFVHALTTHYSFTRGQVVALVHWACLIESLDCDRATLTAALTTYETHPKLSFEDCLLAEQAQAHKATPLWTFDSRLARQHQAARLLKQPL